MMIMSLPTPAPTLPFDAASIHQDTQDLDSTTTSDQRKTILQALPPQQQTTRPIVTTAKTTVSTKIDKQEGGKGIETNKTVSLMLESTPIKTSNYTEPKEATSTNRTQAEKAAEETLSADDENVKHARHQNDVTITTSKKIVSVVETASTSAMEDADQAKDAPTDAFTVTYDCQGDLCQASTNTTTTDSNVAAEIVSANNDNDDFGAGTESTNHRAGNGGAGGIRNTTDDMAPLPDVLEQQLEALMPPNQVLTIMNPEIIGNNGSNDNNYEAHGDDEVAMPDATMRSYGMIFGLAVCSVTSGLIYLTQKRRDNFFAKDEPQSNKVVNDPTYTASDYCDSRVVAYPFATMAQDITVDVTFCSINDPDRGAQDTLESTLEPVILNEAAPDSALAPKQEKQVSKDAIDSVVPPKNGSLGVATSVTPPVTYIMPRPEEAMYHIEEVFDVSGTNFLEKDGDNVVVEFSIDEDDGALQTSPVFEFTARSLVDVNFDSNGNDRSAIASDNEDGMVEHLNENEDARQALALINLTVVNDNNGAEAPTSLDMSIVVDPAAANGICFNGTMPLASGTGFAMKTPTNTALPLSMAALYLVYKGYKMCCRNTVNSYDLCELMQYWRETLERSGRPCRTGKFGGGVFRYDPSSYETLTKGDLHQVLKEGFHYAARSDSKKYDLICKLCSKYEAALNAMTKAGIREVLEVNGVDAPDRIKKDDLVLLALEVGF